MNYYQRNKDKDRYLDRYYRLKKKEREQSE